MSDEAPVTPDTPTSTTDADTDWQKRYSDLQPEYTRTTQALKDEQAIWDDEQAVLARIAEKHPHLMADDTPPDDDDDDVDIEDDDPRLEKLTELETRQKAHDEWIAEQSQKAATEQFNKDLGDEAGDRTLSRQAREWIFNETIKLGDGRENLKKALASWIEYEDADRQAYFETVKKSKRAPHIQANGQTATGTKPVEDMTREEHTAWMVEQALAREHQ